jgi:hypothetical protein
MIDTSGILKPRIDVNCFDSSKKVTLESCLKDISEHNLVCINNQFMYLRYIDQDGSEKFKKHMEIRNAKMLEYGYSD